MRTVAILIAAVAALASGACGRFQAESGGTIVERSYPVGAFHGIEVAGPYEVEVRTGGAPSVTASGPDRLIERLVVEVKGGRLLIRPRSDDRFHWGRSKGKARIRVSAPMIRAAAIAGSGGLTVDSVRGESFEGSIAGSGDLRLQSVDLQSLALSIGGSGSAKAAGGQVRDARYSIAGSGGIDTKAVRTGTASISIAGSGSVDGQATETADVGIMGSGDVRLSGGGKCTVSKMGSGKVACS